MKKKKRAKKTATTSVIAPAAQMWAVRDGWGDINGLFVNEADAWEWALGPVPGQRRTISGRELYVTTATVDLKP